MTLYRLQCPSGLVVELRSPARSDLPAFYGAPFSAYWFAPLIQRCIHSVEDPGPYEDPKTMNPLILQVGDVTAMYQAVRQILPELTAAEMEEADRYTP